MKVELIADGLSFPEGPVVMADGSVIVVEIAASRVSRCWAGHSGKARRETICEIRGGPNGAAIGPDSALYICNNGGMDHINMSSAHGPGAEGRIERLDLASGKAKWSAQTYRIFGLEPGTPVDHELFLSRIHPDDLPGVDGRLRGGAHHAFVVVLANDFIQCAAINGLGHIKQTARAQHTRHFVQCTV